LQKEVYASPAGSSFSNTHLKNPLILAQQQKSFISKNGKNDSNSTPGVLQTPENSAPGTSNASQNSHNNHGII
jgi:hypothetical protein